MIYVYGEFEAAKKEAICPRCHAWPGENCVTPQQKTWYPPHTVRIAELRKSIAKRKKS